LRKPTNLPRWTIENAPGMDRITYSAEEGKKGEVSARVRKQNSGRDYERLERKRGDFTVAENSA